MNSLRSTAHKHAKIRLALVILGGLAGVAVGLGGVYGIARLTGNAAVEPACQTAVEATRRMAPLARGEVAAVAVAKGGKREEGIVAGREALAAARQQSLQSRADVLGALGINLDLPIETLEKARDRYDKEVRGKKRDPASLEAADAAIAALHKGVPLSVSGIDVAPLRVIHQAK